MHSSLLPLLQFSKLMHAYRKVERKVLTHGVDAYENDVEHSYTLAMLAWYLNATHSLGMDTDKLLRYALAHDVVEVYAGDTYFYQTNADAAEDKHKREEEAATRLEQELPQFRELHDAIAAYEKRDDRESKFVYALDKLEPIISIYLDGGATWKKEGVTLELLTKLKSSKVAIDPAVESIFKELHEVLVKEEKNLFPKQ